MENEIKKIADAVLYEGYALFPYRPNTLKNRKRFNFGILMPQVWAQNQINESFFQQCEILIETVAETEVFLNTRFLRLSADTEETSEECFESSFKLGENREFDFRRGNIAGKIKVFTRRIAENLFKIRFRLENPTAVENAESFSREEILPFSLISAQTIFALEKGSFVSLLEPSSAEFLEEAQKCENTGVFPVLIGDETAKNMMLAAPIILYDFPQIAVRSLTDFFDGTEIDELMILNLRALPESEKALITDKKARRILEKIETASAEDLMKLHGDFR